MKKYNLVIALLIIGAILVGGWFIIQQGNKVPTQTTSAGTNTANEASNIIEITSAGFIPSTLTIKQGEQVTFVNKGSQASWPASDIHPSHRAYDGTSLSQHCQSNTSFDACRGLEQGRSYSFTFDNIGSWGYHDHLNPSHTGIIVVE